MPQVKAHIKSEEDKVKVDFAKELGQALPAEHKALPASGMSKDAVVAVLSKRANADKAMWNTGKVSGTVYHGGADLQSLLKEAYGLFSLANPLHSDLFNNCRNMEAVRLF